MNSSEHPSLLLDLVNSRIAWPDGVRDELGEDAAAREWLQVRGATGSPEEIEGAREVRPVLVAVLRGEQDPAALGPWAQHMRKKAVLDGARLAWDWDVPARQLIGARAIEEWASLQTATTPRVRPCADPNCQHFLIDRSPGNRRRWHSMESCGNRTKARRHYARTKAATQGRGSDDA